MKYFLLGTKAGKTESHPVWDEWIEINKTNVLTLILYQSHPVWDEWIEICSFKGNRKLKKSHPVWDEWIEINILHRLQFDLTVSSRLG